MKNPKVLYILISLFCIFAIIAGIYAQFIDASPTGTGVAEEEQNVIQEKTQDEIKSDFNDLFTNELNLGTFDTTGIQKNDQTQEIVYSLSTERVNEFCEINLNIPVINIRSDLSNTFNSMTQADFVNKANEVIQNTDSTKKIIYTVDYTAYVNSNILSVVIKSTLKEGNSAQRVIVRTYNYNLSTNQEASLVDLITMKMLNKDEVNNKIMQVVTAENQEAENLQSMGYNTVFVRDLASDMYNIDNAGAYFLGPNQELYIVYPYGNSEFTSEMDIILFE